MEKEQFKIPAEKIKDLIKLQGFGIVSNHITVDGMKVGYMYREERFDKEDTGWRFLSGTETQEYIDDPETSKVFSINAIANYDPAILPYIKLPEGTELERVEGSDEFKILTE
ncbi:MAG: DUF2185 domain-containing protein [Bacteroidales bacterium]|jgi:hypothetical protein